MRCSAMARTNSLKEMPIAMIPPGFGEAQVIQRQPVVGIEQGESVVQRFDGVDQSALKVLLLQLGCPKRPFRAFLFVERSSDLGNQRP